MKFQDSVLYHTKGRHEVTSLSIWRRLISASSSTDTNVKSKSVAKLFYTLQADAISRKCSSQTAEIEKNS